MFNQNWIFLNYRTYKDGKSEMVAVVLVIKGMKISMVVSDASWRIVNLSNHLAKNVN